MACAVTLQAETNAPVFRYGYLPSAHAVRYFLGTNAPPTGVTGWDVKLIRASDNKQIARQSGRFPIRDANGFTMKVPALQDGEYKLQLLWTGAGVNQPVAERTFPHVTYPWTGTDLGKADVLIPPFTAIEVDRSRQTVATILRTHTMSDAGLWAQVESQGIDLLTGPMRLEVVVGGQTKVATGKGVRFTKRSPTKVTGKATWSAGPIRGATTMFNYDYDGLMKVALKLPATTQKINSLKLIIPLKDAEAKFMHAVTDKLRGHPSQTLRAGDGKLWDSANIWRTALPAPFVPYCWVGGAERGIAWCAENDKDWIVQPTDAVLELERNDGAVSMVVKLITVPSVLTRARTIQFALQATPAKPMPTAPAHWRRWGYSWCDGDVNFEFFGGGRIWGQQMDCTAFYPAFRDFSIFDELVKSRQLGVNDGEAFTENWLKQFPPDLPTIGSYIGLEQYRHMVNAGLSTARSRTKNSVKATKVRDSSEAGSLLPLTMDGGDANCSYQPVSTNLSPFLSSTFTTNTASALWIDNSTSVNPHLETSGFGITSHDWVNIQFDVRPVAGDWSSWKYVAQTADGAAACDIRVQGNRFILDGRRVPNIEVVAGDWYHFFITCAPAGLPTAERTCDVTITRQDSTGKRTYGTVHGVLQEGDRPIDVFRVSSLAKHGRGSLQVDNLLINTIKPFWLLAYTNARGINWFDDVGHMSENGTYNDEWTIYDVADPRWDEAAKAELRFLRERAEHHVSQANAYGLLPGVWYDVDPVPSMVDMMVYYHKKMLENGMVEGIYWDDFFLQANYNPVTGPGYVGDDGQLHAGVNIYAFRDLIKRTAVMQHHDLRMPPLTFPHMSNVNIVPILSFATLILDLEELGAGTQETDLQDRFGLDQDCAKVFNEMTGFQTGSIGLIHDQFNGTNRAHVLRTAMAVALTHEFKLMTYDTASFFPTYERLAKFGYGEPDCTVYRYWEGPQPVTASGAPVRLLVLQRPHETANKAYIIAGSFGDGGDVDLTLDATALKLPAGYRVYDDETGTELSPLAPNHYRVNIVKHEFKLVRVQ